MFMVKAFLFVRSAVRDRIPGGLADGRDPRSFDAAALAEGVAVELEHTSDRRIAREIAMDHLAEDAAYYRRLREVERRKKRRPKPLAKAQVKGHTRIVGGRLIYVAPYTTRTVAARPPEPTTRQRAAMEAPTGKIKRELTADTKRMWRMETISTYRSTDYPLLAVREAMQNSIDAVRKARERGVLRGRGRFSVDISPDNKEMTIEDNGIGMSSEDLDDKFLKLGGTGKGNEPGAVGGFGVAKAVILGASATEDWDIHTRDNYIHSSHLGREVDAAEQKREHRDGTRLTIRGLAQGARGEHVSWGLRSNAMVVLGAYDVGAGIDMEVNGERVKSLFDPKKGKPIHFNAQWPEGTSVTVRAYRRKDKTTGAMYVRLGGLYQFHKPFYSDNKVPYDLVLDVETTARPGTEEYPFQKGRDGFRGQAESAIESIRQSMEQDSKSAARDEVWETTTFEGAPEDRPATRQEREQVEAVEDAVRDEDFVKALAEIEQTVSDVSTEPTTRPGTGPQKRERSWDMEEPDVPETGAGLAGVKPGVAQRMLDASQIAGTLKVGAADNPFRQAWMIQRNKQTYGKRKFDFKKHLPLLAAWDATLRIIAQHGGVRHTFVPGFVLDPDVHGLQASEGLGDTRQRGVLINPHSAMHYAKSPEQLAHFLFTLGCHELAHVGRTGDGHNEAFSSAREDLAISSIGAFPAIVKVVSAAMRKPMKPATANKLAVQKTKAKKERVARTKTRARMDSPQLSLF